MKAISGFVLLASVATCGIVAAQPATNDAKIDQTLKDWKARYERLKSVRYKLAGTEESFGGPVVKGFPAPIPGARPVRTTVLVDLIEKRYRLDEERSRPAEARDRYVKFKFTEAFNGKIHQRAVPRDNEERSEEIPDISIAKGDLTMARVDSYLEPVFYAHGLIPTEESPLGPGRFPMAHEPEDFHLKGVGSHAGRICLMLRTGPASTTPAISDEYWTDPQRQSAVLRQIHWQGKNPWFRIDIDHQQTPHGWLPLKWVVTHTIDGEVRNITRLSVEAIEANPSLVEDDFTLPIKPGMKVRINEYPGKGKGLDSQTPARTELTVGLDGSEEVTKREGFRTKEGVQLPAESGSKWWWIGGVSLVVFLAGFFAFTWARKRRSAVGPNPS